MTVYIVDSNFFIEAHRNNYPIDIATSFWNKVRQLAETGVIVSIDKVKSEIFGHNDILEEWCNDNLPNGFFKDSSAVFTEYSQVVTWATSQRGHYLTQAINEFLDANEADAFLVAYALRDKANLVVVTQEKSQPDRKNKVKIPEACNALNVRFVNTIEMFRQLNETF